MATLILLRHGQSQWNLAHRFTGWVDVDLTQKGEGEAMAAGEALAAEHVDLDIVFTSVLTRAIRTANLALAAAGQLWVPMIKDWRLNERHYGGLTGLEHAAMAQAHGEAQVRIWRRSYDVPPPPLAPGGEFDFAVDRRYAGLSLPSSESLKMTLERVLPYWNEAIASRLIQGQNVMVAAHGNSLRAIAKHLFSISDADITGLEIPTGNPLQVTLDQDLKPRAARYLNEAGATQLPPI